MSRDLPTVLQHEEDSSGAVCLAMLLRHHGRPAPVAAVTRACHADRDGVTPNDLAAAAREFGLAATVHHCEPDELPPEPVIVQWRFRGYVIAAPARRGGWHVHDPVVGHRHCRPAEFDEAFTGVAVTVTPPQEGRRSSRSGPSVLPRIWHLLGNLRPITVYAMVAGLLLIVPMLVVPRIIQLYGNGLMAEPAITAMTAIVGLLLAAAVTAALHAVQAGLSVRFARRSTLVLDVRLLDRLLGLPLAFFERRSTASLTQRTTLADELANGISALLLTGVGAAFTGLAGTVVLFVVDVWTGVTAAVVAVSSALVVHRLLERDHDAVLRLVHEQLQVGVLVSAVFNQITAVKAGGHEEAWIGRGIDAEHRLLRGEQRLALRSLVLRSAPALLGAVGTAIIAAVAAGRALAGDVPASSFAAVLVVATLTITPLVSAAAAVEQARSLAAALERVDDVLAEMAPTAPSPRAWTETSLSGAVELQGVSFAYSPWGPPALADIDLSVAPGELLVVAGTPGAGCSTLASLLAGVMEPTTGSVLFDGVPASRLAAAPGQVAVVRQDVSTVEASWRTNVTLHDHGLTGSSVARAMAEAGVTEAVARQPSGADTVVAPGGGNIAAGEWRQIGVARALARDPAVLVLDATLQSLDAVTATGLLTAVRARGITCLLLGAPSGLVSPADRVVLLDGGRIVARGSHADLLRAHEGYRRVVAT